jgi:ubiquinone/menaquinone biosynthesis C-methylase UbiE
MVNDSQCSAGNSIPADHSYDAWYQRFEGAVEHAIDWQLLQRHLPKGTTAAALDAAGGTGRIALPLAQLGYSVTLLDICDTMLAAARGKAAVAGVADRVGFLRGDIRQLPLVDQSFDLVLCWDGGRQAAMELARVARPGALISLFLENGPELADHDRRVFEMIGSADLDEVVSRVLESATSCHSLDTDAFRQQFADLGLEVIDIYAVCGWLDVLGYPEETRNATDWDDPLFQRTCALVLQLGQEPSVRGLSRHLVVYAHKR